MKVAVVRSRRIDSSQEIDARFIGRTAIRSLWHELALHPKPGLVSLADTGAHDDMDATTFVRSLFGLSRFFGEVAQAGANGATFRTLSALGVAAEASMLEATRGVNTHRGAIFALGLLCAAAGRAYALNEAPTDATLRRVLLAAWGAELRTAHARAGASSHGMQAVERYGVIGARGEAARAFPAVFDVALPALRDARTRGCDERHARLSAFFALLARVDDTNVLYRGGVEALEFVRGAARAFHDDGDAHTNAPLARAEAIHRKFVARRLSPGGCADLLAGALFVQAIQTRGCQR